MDVIMTEYPSGGRQVRTHDCTSEQSKQDSGARFKLSSSGYRNHKHQLRACYSRTSCVPAASGRLHVAGTAELWAGRILGQNCSCRARLTLKLRMRSARAALVRINSVCSALMAGQARAAARCPLGLEHFLFQTCLLSRRDPGS